MTKPYLIEAASFYTGTSEEFACAGRSTPAGSSQVPGMHVTTKKVRTAPVRTKLPKSANGERRPRTANANIEIRYNAGDGALSSPSGGK